MSKIFHTNDIVLAAALKVKGYTLLGIEKQGNKGTFKFEDVNDAFLEEYDLGHVQVEPVMFNNAIKALTSAARR